MNLEELCSWLSHQKGMMAQTYAKDLAKYIVRTKERCEPLCKPSVCNCIKKELSDEEIDKVLYSMDWAHDPVKFARAILKKASEK
jgi:hypothetical protein